jgi:hypothetical protein
MFNSIRKVAGCWLLLMFSITIFGNAPQFSEESNSIPELRWQKNIIPITFSKSLLKPNPAIKKDSDILGALERSLKVWEEAANIEFLVTWTDKQSISPSGKTGDGISLVTVAQTAENLLVFNGEVNEVSARTRVFFSRRGLISEADIILNPYQQFSTDGSFGTFDFEATLTHEIGHLLGLEHSLIDGATMSEHQGKNGVYNLTGFSARTLSEDDKSSIRGIYGANKVENNCCGIVDGKILLPGGKTARNLLVWVEEKETGKIFAGTTSNSQGSFQFKGLPVGKYDIFVQGKIDSKKSLDNFVSENLDEIEVKSQKTTVFEKQIEKFSNRLEVEYLGFNGQLSKLAVPINAGKSYPIYLGGKNLDINDISVQTNSRFLNIAETKLIKYDFGSEFNVFSFELNVESEISEGEYTLLFQNEKGQKSYLVGKLTVEQFSNPWIIYDLK